MLGLSVVASHFLPRRLKCSYPVNVQPVFTLTEETASFLFVGILCRLVSRVVSVHPLFSFVRVL